MANTTIQLLGRGLRGESYGDTARRLGLFGILPTDTDQQVMEKINADAAGSAAAAEAAAGPTYPDVATGLAATPEGQGFAVNNGDGTVTVYLNDSGVAVEQRTLATVAYLAGTTGASLIGTPEGTVQGTLNTLRLQEKSLLDFVPPEYHASIRDYSYSVDCFHYIQSAFDWATANNAGLYVPAGGYLIDGGSETLYLVNNWGANKNLIVRGAGMGLTVFKEADGKTNRVGRYCKMMYFFYGNAGFVGDFGHLKFTDMTFDKNGSSNVNASTLYNYEQAHIISFAGSGTMNIASVHFENVEITDKIGGGINFSSSPNVKIGKGFFNNIVSQKNPKVTIWGDGTFGSRGCLEFGTNFGVLDINTPQLQYAQIEPVTPSTISAPRYANVSGGSIDVVEWTDSGGYSYATFANSTVRRKFLVRGVNASATACTLKVTDTFGGGIVKIMGGTILLDYNPTTNAVTAFTHGQPLGYSSYSELWLSDLSIQIDSDDAGILPTGYGLSGGTSGNSDTRRRFIQNVKFDTRLEGSIDAYRNGDWRIANCDLTGRLYQVAVGGTSTHGGNVELYDNAFLGTGIKISVNKINELWTLKVRGSYPLADFWRTTGSAVADNLILQFPDLYHPSAPGSSTFAFKGQVVRNSAFAGTGVQSWVKVETGTGGVGYKAVLTVA